MKVPSLRLFPILFVLPTLVPAFGVGLAGIECAGGHRSAGGGQISPWNRADPNPAATCTLYGPYPG